MSDTPRTDAECGWYDPNGIRYQNPKGDHVDPDFARQLERELAAANERIRRLEKAARELKWCIESFVGSTVINPDPGHLIPSWLSTKMRRLRDDAGRVWTTGDGVWVVEEPKP